MFKLASDPFFDWKIDEMTIAIKTVQQTIYR